MGVEKRILGEEDKNRDDLSLEKAAEEKVSAVETNQELDAEFEDLRKATEIKDQIFTKIESTLNQAIEGKPYLKKHIDTGLFFGSIEDLFYKLPEDKDKVMIMESILTILESCENYSIEEIYEKISGKIEDKLSFVDDPESLKTINKLIYIISLLLVFVLILGGSILEAGVITALAGVLWCGLQYLRISNIEKSDEIDIRIDRNKFFDQINEYVPNITREDFDQLFDNVSEIGMTSYEESYLQEKITAILKDYKENDGVVTQEEISALIKFTEDMEVPRKKSARTILKYLEDF